MEIQGKLPRKRTARKLEKMFSKILQRMRGKPEKGTASRSKERGHLSVTEGEKQNGKSKEGFDLILANDSHGDAVEGGQNEGNQGGPKSGGQDPSKKVKSKTECHALRREIARPHIWKKKKLR